MQTDAMSVPPSLTGAVHRERSGASHTHEANRRIHKDCEHQAIGIGRIELPSAALHGARH